MTYSLTSFAGMLMEAFVLLPAAEAEAMEKAAKLLEAESKRLIGFPQPSWPPLADVTIANKDGVNSPLLDTGEMQDSITHNSDRHEAYIGSDNKKLLFHEFGSDKTGNAWGSRNPPRPVLGLAVVNKGDEAARLVGREVLTAIKIL